MLVNKRKTYTKHDRLDISSMTEDQMRTKLGIIDPEINIEKRQAPNGKNYQIIMSFCEKARIRHRGRRSNVMTQLVDVKTGLLDFTQLRKKLQILLSRKHHDDNKHRVEIEEYSLRDHVYKNVRQQVNILSPDAFYVDVNGEKIKISLTLMLSTPEQVARIIQFVNSDPEMGVERMLRVMKKAK